MREFEPQKEIKFSEAQKDAAVAISKEMATSGERKAVLITGLPGVGKSEVANMMDPVLKVLGGSTRKYNDQTSTAVRYGNGLSVVTTTPLEEARMKEQIDPQSRPIVELTTHRMKGMTPYEMTNFLKRRLDGEIPSQEIVEVTMGIPRLGKAMTSQLDKKPDVLAAEYLGRVDLSLPEIANSDYQDVRTALEPYIHMPPSKEVYDRSRDYRRQELENSYPVKISDAEQRSSGQVSAKFVDSETLAIYRRVENLTNEQLKATDTKVVIHVPTLSREAHQIVAQSLGLSEENRYFKRGDIPDAIADSPRGKMFRIQEGKISARITEGSQTETYAHHDLTVETINGRSIDIREYVNGSDANQGSTTSITLGCKDYPVFYRNSLKFGHMTESLFQNLGVSYIAYNGIADQVYAYQAEKHQIKPLKKIYFS